MWFISLYLHTQIWSFIKLKCRISPITLNELFSCGNSWFKIFRLSLDRAMFNCSFWLFVGYILHNLGSLFVLWRNVLLILCLNQIFYSRLFGGSVCLVEEIRHWRRPIAGHWMSLEISSSVNTFFNYLFFLPDGFSLIAFTLFDLISCLLIYVLK